MHLVSRDATPLLLCTGSLNIDIIAAVPEFPRRDGRITAQPFQQRLGGMAGNAACAAAALGDCWPHRVLLVAPIGNDSNSSWAENELQTRGVATDWLDRNSTPYTPRCVILVEPDGARTIVTEPTRLLYTRIDACLDACQEHRSRKLIYAEGHHLPWMQEQLVHARNLGWRIAVDIDGMPLERLSQTYFEAIVLDSDIVFLNTLYAETLFADPKPGPSSQSVARLQTLADCGTTLILLTLGAAGALLISPMSTPLKLPTLRVEVKDTTGAGDVFAGVFCAAWLCEIPPARAAAYATLAATLSTTALGAVGYLATAAELEAQLQEMGTFGHPY